MASFYGHLVEDSSKLNLSISPLGSTYISVNSSHSPLGPKPNARKSAVRGGTTLSELVRVADDLHSAHLEASSINRYLSYGAHYVDFCRHHRVPVVPVRVDVVWAYVVEWCRIFGNSANSLHSRFAGIRWYLLRLHGPKGKFLPAGSEAARRINNLISGMVKVQGRPIRKSFPLTDKILSVLIRRCRQSSGSPFWQVQ